MSAFAFLSCKSLKTIRRYTVKNILKAIFIMAIIITLLICLAACIPNIGRSEESNTECYHIWKDATCTAPKTCYLCDQTEGDILGHKWWDANCTRAKHCSRCNETEGSALGHKYSDGDFVNPLGGFRGVSGLFGGGFCRQGVLFYVK